MVPAIESTAGSPNANSLVSLAEANTYFSERIGTPKWLDADDTVRARALIHASRELSRREFVGARYRYDQALAWPRSGVYRDGRALDTDKVPERVKHACCEYAETLVQTLKAGEDTGESSALNDFKSIKIGPLAFEMRDTTEQVDPLALPEVVDRMLGDWLLSSEGGGIGTIDLLRG